MIISYEPYFAEAFYRCQIGVNEVLSKAENRAVFTEGAWMHRSVRAVRQIILSEGEVTGLRGVEEEFRILEPSQVSQLAAMFGEIEKDNSRNPYEVAWNQVAGIDGNFGWAQRLQAERIDKEQGQWELPNGMYHLYTDEDGDMLLMYLGFVPDAGSTVQVDCHPGLREFLLELIENESLTRLAAFSEKLGFTLELKPYPADQA